MADSSSNEVFKLVCFMYQLTKINEYGKRITRVLGLTLRHLCLSEREKVEEIYTGKVRWGNYRSWRSGTVYVDECNCGGRSLQVVVCFL